jgi:leader peptidase (prepilin peptidase)/N-methyltransferase
MIVAVGTAFLFVTLFLLGSAVGSFLNVCIVRLPQGRSLIRPASCCGHCQTAIRSRDNIPLVSYWLLRGRCRACGAPFSMRYFWIELLTGLLFVLIYHIEIARNIHRFETWAWYENDYESVLMRMFDAQLWTVFAVHALLGCFLIVATMCLWEQGRIPASVTRCGVALGLLASLLFPWPWPDTPAQAVVDSSGNRIVLRGERKAYSWGPRIGAMPGSNPWWLGDTTPHNGLYSWPLWGPPPSWLPTGSHELGLATGLAGVAAAAVWMGLARILFNAAVGVRAVGWGETHWMMIAGAFLGWQPITVAAFVASVPGLLTAARQWRMGRRVSFVVWLVGAIVGVWFGWYWIGPLVQGLFFNERRLLLFMVGTLLSLMMFAVCLRGTVARTPSRT